MKLGKIKINRARLIFTFGIIMAILYHLIDSNLKFGFLGASLIWAFYDLAFNSDEDFFTKSITFKKK